MPYNRCGNSGLKLPALSLGLWHNFGDKDNFENMQMLVHTAFDRGITHFDLANNYGPMPGAAEENFGRILAKSMHTYRDEMIISTKAGYDMWDGPYGNFGSRKYLLASLDQSLRRMGLDYVDIFYHHREDPETPLEESMGALDTAVRRGKALYAGISNYSREKTEEAISILRELGTPLLIHQPKYSMFQRHIESTGLKDFAHDKGIGMIAFSPLAQGLLTNKYIDSIPEDSRIGRDGRFLNRDAVTEELRGKLRALNAIAAERGQQLAQMALSWVLRDGKITSVLIGASKPSQIIDNIEAADYSDFTAEELAKIESILGE